MSDKELIQELRKMIKLSQEDREFLESCYEGTYAYNGENFDDTFEACVKMGTIDTKVCVLEFLKKWEDKLCDCPQDLISALREAFDITEEFDLAEDEELADFFETDTEQGNGLMSKIIKHDTIEVKKVGKDAITYKITAPDLSNLFSDMKAGNVTEENIDSFMDDYISDAKMVTNEVDVSYTYENEKFSAEYDTEEFINALTGNMVTAYQELIQDVQNEISEEDNNEESN